MTADLLPVPVTAPPRHRSGAGLSRLVRTTAFKLITAYLAIFILFAGSLLAYFAWNTERLLRLQISGTVDAEISALADQYAQGGMTRLIDAVDRRSQRPGLLLYLVTTGQGQSLAGNVSQLPGTVLSEAGWSETTYAREGGGTARTALVRVFVLPGGFRLLVGLDLEEQQRVRSTMTTATIWSGVLIVALGVAGGWFVTRRVLRRLDDVTQTSRSIMSGDLARRLAVAGTGDEMDRLALTTNAMLDRIEELMGGVKAVSDAIAHDLKTPLTRLRNRAEEALRVGQGEADFRQALHKTIDESDALIRTFDALLMIARAESGQMQPSLVPLDAGEVAGGVAELYEAVAEEQGGTLAVDIAGPLPVRGHRELLGQAVANLIDNALKHGARGEAPAAIALAARRVGGTVEIAVADRGEGIPQADRDRVLGRFVRLESSRSRPGSGLGLSLVAAIAHLHGGTVRLEDNAPGLRVVLALPAGEA